MPRATIGDTSLTRSYITKVSQTPGISPSIAHFYKPIKDRCIHEGRVVDQLYYISDHIDHCFSNIRLNCLYKINKPIVPRFVLDLYSQVTLQGDDSGVILISFMIQNEFITLSLQQFSQILTFHSMAKPIESARATPKAHLPYGMFLTCLFRYVMEHYPHLANDIYNVFDHVMRPLALKQTRRPQRDVDEDDGASRASTPSPTTYLNSLKPLNYQRYQIPSPSEQSDDLLFERQTELLNQTQENHKEVRGGFKSFGKALRGVFAKKKK
ncbi:hypothetical protein Tco_1355132 [Tanacetum coccineum]